MKHLIERAVICFALSSSSAAVASQVATEVQVEVEKFEDRTGIDLHLLGDDDEPATAKMPKNMAPVDPELAAKMLPTMEKVLLQYPESIRGGLLQHVHLIGKLKMRGKPFLGLARPKLFQIDMAIRPRTKPKAFASTLHHEISHLIEGDPRFPKTAWLAISKGDYQGNLKSAPKLSRTGYHELGFVTRYASRNRHEDFAEMVELGFKRPKKLQRLAKKHERIRDKVVMMTAVYSRVAPTLDAPWVTPALARLVRETAPARIAEPPSSEPKSAPVHRGHRH